MKKILKSLVCFCLMFVCVFGFSACKSGRASLAGRTLKFKYDIEGVFSKKQSFEGNLASLGEKTNEEWLEYFFTEGIIDWSKLNMPMSSSFASFKEWIETELAPNNDEIGKVKISSEEKGTLTYNDVVYDVEMDDSHDTKHYMYLNIYEKDADKTDENIIGTVNPGSWDYGRKGKITKHNIKINIEGVLSSEKTVYIPLVFDEVEGNPTQIGLTFSGNWKFV